MKKGKNYALLSAELLTVDNTVDCREVFHDKIDLSGIELSVNRIAAGTSIPFVHAHKRNEEVYIILEGIGTAYVDGEEFPVSVGDVLRVDPEGKRCFRAGETQELKYICIQSEKGSLVQHTRRDGYPVKVRPSWMS